MSSALAQRDPEVYTAIQNQTERRSITWNSLPQKTLSVRQCSKPKVRS